MKRDEVIFKALGLLKEARLALEMWKDVAPAVSLCADIDKVLAKLAALAPEPNQPEGTGRYELTTMVEVNPGNMVSIGDNDWYSLESITGHWRKVEP